MSFDRWIVKNAAEKDAVVDMHRTESNAVLHAIFLNDQNQTDSYYVEKVDKRQKWWDIPDA